MISRLRGVLVSKQPPLLVLDVAGVGYEVEATLSTFYQLPEVGKEIIIQTHMIVREDAQLLYGFVDERERALFRSLIRVSGVGPKLALSILSGSSVDEFIRCVHESDIAALTKVPGVGKKTAERLVMEMRDRLEKEPYTALGASAGTMAGQNNAVGDAIGALVALGYKPNDASRMVKRVQADDQADGMSREDLIRAALKQTSG